MTREEKEIGGRIKYLREENNYTRDELAEKIGISAKFLYEIETGKKRFSAETLVKIAQAVSVSCDYIMLGNRLESKEIEDISNILRRFSKEQLELVGDMLRVMMKLFCKE